MTKLSKGQLIRQVQADSVMTNAEIAEKIDLTESQVRRAVETGMMKLRLKAIACEMKFDEYFE